MTKAQKLLNEANANVTTFGSEDFILVDLESIQGWELAEMVADDGKKPNYFLTIEEGFLIFANKPIDKAAARKFFDKRWQRIE